MDAQEQKFIRMTQMIADLLTVLCAIPLQIHVLRSLPKQDVLKQ